MIADHETNVVFVADTLELEFPAMYSGLSEILGRHGIPLRIIPGTRSIWCRDYMPIQVAEDRFVQFRYAPDYLTGKYRHLRADGLIGPRLPYVKNCEISDIVLDGGNVVKSSDSVIMTDKIMRENAEWNSKSLLAELERLLKVERIILIPSEPGDVAGHADGVVRFVNDGRVVVNDYRRVDRNYRKKLLRSLDKVGLELIEIPYQPVRGFLDGMPSAVGLYVNYLEVGPVLILPLFDLPEDLDSRAALSKVHPERALYALPCRHLAREGGVLNCISSTIHSPSGEFDC